MEQDVETFRVIVAAELDGERLDRALAALLPQFSRERLKALIRGGRVRLGERTIVEPKYRVNAGAEALLDVPPPAPAAPAPQAIPLDIAYEDDHVIVVEKPAGLVVHPGAGTPDGTLVNALLHHCAGSLSGIGGVERPGIVHRLDKHTSGLIVAAKTDAAHRHLAEQFADHGRTGDLERGYLALVWGVPARRRGIIDQPLARSPQNPERMAVRPGGRRAVTRYETRQVLAGAEERATASLIECRLETGRTHQIRVHLAHLGHPLLGDTVYGAGFASKARLLTESQQRRLEALGRQALHAYLLVFRHPVTGTIMRFESPLPDRLQALLDSFAGT